MFHCAVCPASTNDLQEAFTYVISAVFYCWNITNMVSTFNVASDYCSRSSAECSTQTLSSTQSISDAKLIFNRTDSWKSRVTLFYSGAARASSNRANFFAISNRISRHSGVIIHGYNFTRWYPCFAFILLWREKTQTIVLVLKNRHR